MSKENTATERLSITANVVLLGSYLFMGVCLLAGAILVLTQPLPFAENPMVMKVGMGWVMIPVSLFIICSNIIKIVRRRNAIVIDESGITDNTDSMGSGFTPWEQISEVFLLRLKDDTYLCAVPTDYDSWASTRNRRQARLGQANKDMGFAPSSRRQPTSTRPRTALPPCAALLPRRSAASASPSTRPAMRASPYQSTTPIEALSSWLRFSARSSRLSW